MKLTDLFEIYNEDESDPNTWTPDQQIQAMDNSRLSFYELFDPRDDVIQFAFEQAADNYADQVDIIRHLCDIGKPLTFNTFLTIADIQSGLYILMRSAPNIIPKFTKQQIDGDIKTYLTMDYFIENENKYNTFVKCVFNGNNLLIKRWIEYGNDRREELNETN